MNKREDILNRAQALSKLIRSRLTFETGDLKQAVEKTTSEGFFNPDDVGFALNHIRHQLDENQTEDWVNRVLSGRPIPEQKETVLCLHAGNLPLVGFQDVVAVLLSGHNYCGKISRKDPYLLPSLLEDVQENDAFGDIRYSTELDDLTGITADRVMFSGSTKSEVQVRERLLESGMAGDRTRYLMRTAHSSAAWISAEALHQPENLPELLAEASFRYQGKGCRTLTSIFTDGNPEMLLKLIREGVESSPYCNKYVLPKKLPELLRFRQAYFKAVGSDLYAAGDRLIAVSDPDVHTEGLITLTKGSREELHAFVAQHRTRLQSVYTADETDLKDVETEPLSQAQKPLLNWKPDGIDPLFWLLDAGTKKQGDG